MKERFLQAIQSSATVRRTGKITQFFGLAVESSGPDVFLGEICEISYPNALQPVMAEVVGFRNGNVLLMPCGNIAGVHVGSEVIATGRSASVAVGDALIGRVLDGFGKPIDRKGELTGTHMYRIHPEPVNPLARKRVDEYLETGILVIDGLLSLGKGQRMGIFAGSGVGKSTLLGLIAKQVNVDVNVIALIGERGREVLDFIDQILGEEGLKKSVVVVAGADQPALVRAHAAYTAMTIAEYFRDQGKDVLLTMDSLTRFAMAQREIGLAIGEPPTARGYTPSTFDKIPRLAERAGNFEGKGSITALFTVLVEGDDFNEPVSDHSRAILDGHIVLTRKLANLGIFPAIDVLQSNSRLKRVVLSESELELSGKALRQLGRYEELRDAIELGVYKKGEDVNSDKVVQFEKSFSEFRSQKAGVDGSRKHVFNWLAKQL